MAQNFDIGELVGLPPAGKKTLHVKADGTFSSLDSAGTETAVGGAGGFGSDTIVDLPNAAAANVAALELLTTLTTPTAGAEVSKLLISLLSAGAQLGLWSLEPAQMITDFGGVLATWDWLIKAAGTEKARLEVSSTGILTLKGTNTGTGGSINLQDTGGNVVMKAMVNWGIQFLAAIQEKQFQNTAAANNLIVPAGGLNGGNGGHITGNTQINLIDTTSWNLGSRLELVFDGTPTVKHNQAPAGNGSPILLAGSVDRVMVAKDRLAVRLMGDNNAGTNIAWYQVAPIVSA